MSSRKTTYFPLPQRIISKYDFCRRHHTVENLAPRWLGGEKLLGKKLDFSSRQAEDGPLSKRW